MTSPTKTSQKLDINAIYES